MISSSESVEAGGVDVELGRDGRLADENELGLAGFDGK